MRGFSRVKDELQKSLKNSKRIIVYTSPNCPRCRQLKTWLKGKNVKFEERNIEESDVMAELILRDIYILSTPALETNGKVYTESELFDGNSSLNVDFLENLLEDGGKA